MRTIIPRAGVYTSNIDEYQFLLIRDNFDREVFGCSAYPCDMNGMELTRFAIEVWARDIADFVSEVPRGKKNI
jgi:hypothetical protein